MSKSPPLRFDVHPLVVFQLGDELITDEVQALIEFVKNCYDAGASYAKVEINTRGRCGDVHPDSLFPDGQGYVAITDDEAIHAFDALCRFEGIIPALESSHALAPAMKMAPGMAKDKVLLVNLSGRGDKDMNTVAQLKGITL